MFGQAFPLGAPDFDGALGEGVVVEVLGVVDPVLAVLAAVVLGVVEAADALVMPAAAPPVASAPATIVAPSSLEIVMGRTSWFGWWGVVMVRSVAKRKRRCVYGLCKAAGDLRRPCMRTYVRALEQPDTGRR
jgi:hypothetical protein